ncbi:MAG: heme exporter protein CcmB [Acidobacteriota bacterium]|nr:heme exporter protein CcmB [Acidobacteriota bacterium]
MNGFRAAFAIARKDLRSELRSKESINAALSFALVILLILSFAFEPTGEETHAIAGGLLWIVFAFSGTLILTRTFARELGNDCLEALIAAPVPGWALFLGKAFASLAMMLFVELVSLPVFAIFYDVTLVWQIAPVLLLGTWALVVVGVSFSALTVNVQLREVMLPLLIYPTLVPALISAMTLTGSLLDGGAFAGNNLIWLRLLVGFDIIYTALAVALIDIVLVG